MVRLFRQLRLFTLLGLLVSSGASAQVIDSDSHRSIIEALQDHVTKTPSVFPLEASEGGVQSFLDGMQYPYFGYGERLYPHRADFHPAFDVAYAPLETGVVTTVHGKKRTVRAPKSYLKRVYAIQSGTLYSAALIGSGYKVVLKHTLEKPYFDSTGRPYSEFFTSFRHLDARSMVYLSLVARRITQNSKATYKDIVGTHKIEAGEMLGYVGFSPAVTKTPPRSHLDFSLNLFAKPNSGQHIRDYSMNPLLLFRPFEYADPRLHDAVDQDTPSYKFVVNENDTVVPGKRRDGRIGIEIHSGYVSSEGVFNARRYFALNAMEISVYNGGDKIGAYTVDRHQKTSYETSSNDRLDNVNRSKPHFEAPLNEQGDIYRMGGVIPASWLKELGYDWSKPGKVVIEVSSIWHGYLHNHSETVEISL